MKKKLRIFWMILCFLIVVLYIISSFSSYISPNSFPQIILFSLAFPFLFLGMIAFTFASFFINKRMALLLLVILPVGYKNTLNTFAFNQQNEWHINKGCNTLRVMTWNVSAFNGIPSNTEKTSPKLIKKEMLATIYHYNPDVLCMQDFWNVENIKHKHSIRWQLDSLGYQYFYSIKDSLRRSNTNIFSDVAIFSKTQFSNLGKAALPGIDNRSLIFGDIQFGLNRVRIFNTHLESFALFRNSIDTNNEEENITTLAKEKVLTGQKLTQTEIVHEAQVKIIRENINKSPYPVIYCGDINSTPASSIYRMLKGDNLQDAFLEKGVGIGATFYKTLPTLRIDVCLADKKFNIEQCKVEQKRLSDHYPLITDISWK